MVKTDLRLYSQSFNSQICWSIDHYINNYYISLHFPSVLFLSLWLFSQLSLRPMSDCFLCIFCSFYSVRHLSDNWFSFVRPLSDNPRIQTLRHYKYQRCDSERTLHNYTRYKPTARVVDWITILDEKRKEHRFSDKNYLFFISFVLTFTIRCRGSLHTHSL